MKKETMKKLLALPKDSQDKVWQLAAERLMQEKLRKNEAPPAKDKQSKK